MALFASLAKFALGEPGQQRMENSGSREHLADADFGDIPDHVPLLSADAILLWNGDVVETNPEVSSQLCMAGSGPLHPEQPGSPLDIADEPLSAAVVRLENLDALFEDCARVCNELHTTIAQDVLAAPQAECCAEFSTDSTVVPCIRCMLSSPCAKQHLHNFRRSVLTFRMHLTAGWPNAA